VKEQNIIEFTTDNNRINNIIRFSFLISIIFIIVMLISCFSSAVINKDLSTAFITVMLGSLIYTLLVLIQNEKNLTNIINKSIKMHKGDIIKKTVKSNKNKDFIFVVIDFLTIMSSVILISVCLFISFLLLLDGNIIYAFIFILLIIFMAMLLYFWLLIQHNNKLSINIKQNKLKSIYNKAGVHLKFDNNKIKKTMKFGTKKSKNYVSKNQKKSSKI
jgi:hypothetical protein